MRRRPAQVACGKVRSRRFPLPAGVITVAVRWYLHAPRGASLSPAQLGGTRREVLGPMAYLDAKARGNSSLPEKQRSCAGA